MICAAAGLDRRLSLKFVGTREDIGHNKRTPMCNAIHQATASNSQLFIERILIGFQGNSTRYITNRGAVNGLLLNPPI